MAKVMVTGACGQIGSELVMELRRKYGGESIVASDATAGDSVLACGHKSKPRKDLYDSGPFEFIEVTNRKNMAAIIKDYGINTVYHLAALLSARGEKNPQLCWDVNMNGLYNLLEIAREQKLKIFWPSSIAVFGPTTPRDNTPQETILSPTTMYGISKASGEMLCDYYCKRYGVDVRGVRYPGIISSETLPGGGTTDYAVAIYYEAIKHKKYTCFVREDTVLPMMYMPDCIRAILELMETDPSRLKHHSNFNLSAMSFSAGEVAAEIKKHIPEFTCEYKPDFRQAIADSWPRSLDDSAAREEWGWKPEYDISKMTEDMIQILVPRLLSKT
jgi:nucleoside-diphosphate-sugar epimerase